MRKYILLLIALYLHIAARGQTEYEYEYWFDNDRSTLQKGHSSLASWNIEADISLLDERLHAIHFHVCDSDSIFSVPVTRHFIKASGLAGMKIRCWFDGDFSTMQEGENTGNVISLDVANLADGYHTLQIQADGGSGAISAPITKGFVKIPQTIGVEDFTCLCMIDNKIFKQEKVPVGQGIVSWDFDVSSLTQGFHRILIQIITPSGAASNVWQSFFLRDATLEEYGELKCVYAIDGAEFYSETGTMANGNFHFDLDVSSLESGLHQITYMLNNGKGITTQTQTQFFIKTPLGGNGISEYWFWLNEQDEEQIQKIILPERKETFQLISLLPLETQPIRSKLFQFRVEDGKAVVYAKNDIHLRFFDAAGRFTDITKQYVDVNVKQEVNTIKTLVSGERETTGWPEDNEIKWYQVDAKRGDSLSFKLDHAATLQVLSPTGKEVHNVYGSESMAWNGLNAEEDGTYYLALHDVTSTQGETISIDYEHIDKYALLEYTPKEVGLAANIIEVQIIGNGYDKLTQACLTSDSDTIWADSINVHSKAVATIQFTLDGSEKTGHHNLLLYFKDEGIVEQLTAQEGLNIVPTEWGEIKIDVAMGQGITQPYPVTISITNTGNISKLYVPFNLAYSNIHSIERMNFENFVLPKDTDDDGWIAGYTENLASMGIEAKVLSLFIPMLGPKETKVMKVSFTAPSNTPFNVFAWTGKAINEPIEEKNLEQTNIPSISQYLEVFDEDPGDINTLYTELNNAVQEMTEATDSVYSSVSSNQNESATKKITKEKYWGICASPFAGLHVVVRVINNRGNHGSRTFKTISRDFLPNAYPLPPTPKPNPGSTPSPPVDPNDIFGYLSQAGSKFIADSVAMVYYTIEFENDPTFAEASAHTIVIKDTLDSNFFDFAKFLPTGIRIGKHEVFLNKADVVTKNNVTSFVKTIDMRPEINAIAQVDGTFSHNTGIAEWRFTSLDPMTMEPTDDLMQGILPVNYNGTSGIGEVMFEIGVKQGKADGTELKNRAGIVFDYEEAILTPTWTNIVDAVAPSSVIDNSWMANDSTLHVTADASDARSGVWKYEWYVQAGENAPWWKEGETYSNSFDYHIYEGIDYGFCVLVTDSAGNVEQKVIERERGFKTYGPDYEDTIEEVPATTIETGDAYDVSGRKVGRKAKGVIIRHSDGTTRKVLIKE